MSLADFEAFVLECLASFDPNMDLTPGSPADVRIVQRLRRRLGSDPFTVDLGVFLQERLRQEFPLAATQDGDAITDLLIKPAMVLFDPFVREIQRIRNSLSFRDPNLLTNEEADALGANLFATRSRGDFARGTARMYFSHPQQVSVSPANFFTSQGGLNFFPTEVQSISTQEMLFNTEGPLYYFDVSIIAENPGAEYNLEVGQLATVTNVASAVRVSNKARFRFGVPAESAADFVGRVDRELSERSLVTERGVLAKVTNALSEVTRLNVVGFGDAEMQRDVLKGGGLGRILAGGLRLRVVADGENRSLSRRVAVLEPVDFAAIIGPTGRSDDNFALTIFDAFDAPPVVRDLDVLRVVDGVTLDLAEQSLRLGASDRCWSLRKRELTLSGIPGGILFPDRPDGSVSVPPGSVHIGGATDVMVRGADFDVASLLLANVVDDAPALSGRGLRIIDSSHVALGDWVLGGNYSTEGDTYQVLLASVGLTLQVLDPPSAGSFRITSVIQSANLSPVLVVTPAITVAPGTFRWRLLDRIDIDLMEPKETRLTGSDLSTIQGEITLDTAGGVDFAAYGVAPGDIVRIYNGLVAGDYTVRQVLTPLFRRLEVDRPLSATVSNLQYAIFRRNPEGGVKLPLIRIRSIDLLDSSAQPIGSKIPYANPIDAQSRAFANVAHGVKADFVDGMLGVVGRAVTAGTLDVAGLTLEIRWTGITGFRVIFSGPNPVSLAAAAEQISQACRAATGIPGLATVVQGNRLALIPVAPGLIVEGGTAMPLIFGDDASYSASDIRSELEFKTFSGLQPALDLTFDVSQVVDGLQIGFYGSLTLTPGGALRCRHDFAPEVGRHLQVGARSIGSARLFFLEPTSIEFPSDAVFSVQAPDGTTRRYFPDPTRSHQQIPALPSGVKPKDGITVSGGNTLTTGSVDFVAKGIRPGDSLIIDYVPIIGGAPLPDPIPSLHTKAIVLNVNGGLDKSVTFIHDDPSIPSDAVTRHGVPEQINRAIGQVVCRINANQMLEFEADADIIIRSSLGNASTVLGFPSSVDARNGSDHQGTYKIVSVAPSQLTVERTFRPTTPTTVTRQQFRVLRSSLQRICATDMAKQIAAPALYYCDVDLVSEGTGDAYNIEANLSMSISGYRADGYSLTTVDPNLSFSTLELPRLHLSPSILEVGVSDDPENATLVSGQNLQVNYERSTLTENVQNFTTAETERVINQSVLARHLIPYFVRLDLAYIGGSEENVVTADLRSHILNLRPQDALSVSDLEKILLNRGATSIANPVDLIAVIHRVDRSISVERSRDRINTGRLAAFVPDVLNVVRQLS